MLNGLRLIEGFSVQGFEDRTGLAFEVVEPAVAAAASRGMLAPNGAGGWRATALGLRFLNDLIASFLPDTAGAIPTPQATNLL
jgi:oxygen-independent coproporphyrinogen-3 oxidase